MFGASWAKAAIGDAKANMNAVKSLFIIFVFFTVWIFLYNSE